VNGIGLLVTAEFQRNIREMFSSIKIALVLVMLAGGAGGFVYVKTLKSDLEISKANNAKLESGIEDQKTLIMQMQKDFESINKAKQELEDKQRVLTAELKNLDDKFNKINSSGKKRDIGDLAVKRTKPVEKIINNASKNALRCVEIAMGSPLTEAERNATKNSEINSECPSLANPNYVPH